ncbi:uncharacterized protein L969DRAFT_90594 [Mixia osmundae IAM 14324]|uniref:Ras-GAP domain-containing protein n=1 Tax=Mixia osmundae (strain CBS 9802 / IAM 14324 / JCM 22182 / KY 12970) TaxID=764103 RepID=G7E1F5_MIXOS|nr:uncharacterized protein L969DRAFT_90594 [Mixia osmundae IAM 14324]KEI36619.1 hypothetical protein L969DRAFT_90594 [Mixia osmundae IAM 14324]GAA96665.1 hypothetical protein E5Q_03336 [Mixia osmundae IAM 14324]
MQRRRSIWSSSVDLDAARPATSASLDTDLPFLGGSSTTRLIDRAKDEALEQDKPFVYTSRYSRHDATQRPSSPARTFGQDIRNQVESPVRTVPISDKPAQTTPSRPLPRPIEAKSESSGSLNGTDGLVRYQLSDSPIRAAARAQIAPAFAVAPVTSREDKRKTWAPGNSTSFGALKDRYELAASQTGRDNPDHVAFVPSRSTVSRPASPAQFNPPQVDTSSNAWKRQSLSGYPRAGNSQAEPALYRPQPLAHSVASSYASPARQEPAVPSRPMMRARTQSVNHLDPSLLPSFPASPKIDMIKSVAGRHLPLGAGDDGTGELYVPGLTGHAHAVSGMNGRLRLQASQPSGLADTNQLPSQNMRAMDSQRHVLHVYEYLCHVGEAQDWLKNCLASSSISSASDVAASMAQNLSAKGIVDLEESLRDGVALAHLARAYEGERVVQRIFVHPKLQFRHSDNINHFLTFVRNIGLPETFIFELVDLYEARNLPKVIFCIHALGHFLAGKGMATPVGNLVGRLEFTDEELDRKQRGLDSSGVTLPNFSSITATLAKETVPVQDHRRAHDEKAARVKEEQADYDRQREFDNLQRQRADEERQRQHEHDEARRQYEREQIERQRQRERAEYERQLEQEQSRELYERQRETRRREQAATELQTLARAYLSRQRFAYACQKRDETAAWITSLQSRARGALIRQRQETLIFSLQCRQGSLIPLQALCRGILARRNMLIRVRELRRFSFTAAALQSVTRGFMVRQRHARFKASIAAPGFTTTLVGFQSFVRGQRQRSGTSKLRTQLYDCHSETAGLQAIARASQARYRLVSLKSRLERNEPTMTRFQGQCRAVIARLRYHALFSHYFRNVDKVVKIQALFRSKQQGQQYRQLMFGKVVPVQTVQRFVHLLSDSNADCVEEIEIERLKQDVVQKIRVNQSLEIEVNELDLKIALLVKNKITLDEIIRSRAAAGVMDAHHGRSVLSAARDPFALSALDKGTLRKLELYQSIFYLLQTKPEYLARLFRCLSQARLGDRPRKDIEQTVLTMFGFAQDAREEHLLLKLIQRSLHEEILYLRNPTDILAGRYAYLELFARYAQSPGDRRYMRETFGGVVKSFFAASRMTLETDPRAIHHTSVDQEEAETGLTSQRMRGNIDGLQALSDPITRSIFVRNLQALRAVTETYMQGFIGSMQRIPFGVRYVAREIFRALRIKFKDAEDVELVRIVGQLIYERWVDPAVLKPDDFAMTENVPTDTQRRNLAEVSRMMRMVASTQYFGQDTDGEDLSYLCSLNEYIAAASARWTDAFFDIIDVPDAETHFQADQYLDYTVARRPVIYISPNEIYSMHSIILQHLEIIAPSKVDALRDLLFELGGAPQIATGELHKARAGEIALSLSNQNEEIQERGQPEEKAVLVRTKRYVVSLLKVQLGDNLFDLLLRPVYEDHELLWAEVLEEESASIRARHRQSRGPLTADVRKAYLDDVQGIAFAELKARALQGILELERMRKVDRADNFQRMLDLIAIDIRTKHRQRLQRQRELAAMTLTLQGLAQKHRYLSDQKKQYHDYVDSAMNTIQTGGNVAGKKKRRLTLPFTRQFWHERDLAKSGQKKPKFGSYKYNAQQLYDKNVLISIDQFSPRQFDKVTLTFSSDEVGVFAVTIAWNGATVKGGHSEFKMEDLLEAQFNNQQGIAVEVAKFNLTMLLHLIGRKFYA